MAELSDILGTILRDLAWARAVADNFSRNISLEYAQDPILSAFPVPRVEIRQAAIELAFAVNTVQKSQVDLLGIVRLRASSFSHNLTKDVFETVIMAASNREEILFYLEKNNPLWDEKLSEQAADALTADAEAVRRALTGQFEQLTLVVSDRLESMLREDNQLWELLQRSMRVRDIQEGLQKVAGIAVKTLVEEAAPEAEAAERNATRLVDVAVTSAELQNVPERLLARVNLVTEIRNYEWSEQIDAEGQIQRRLQSE
jgi:hypothetical protein